MVATWSPTEASYLSFQLGPRGAPMLPPWMIPAMLPTTPQASLKIEVLGVPPPWGCLAGSLFFMEAPTGVATGGHPVETLETR